jgi:hypothetical protein
MVSEWMHRLVDELFMVELDLVLKEELVAVLRVVLVERRMTLEWKKEVMHDLDKVSDGRIWKRTLGRWKVCHWNG